MPCKQREIDKLPPPKTRNGMNVLCLSAPRSGSTSCEKALSILGYRTWEGMAHNVFVENRFPIWDEAIEARYNGKGKPFTREDFDKFLASYDAVGGWGAAILAEDLIAAYPDAKVVLTTRDVDDWVGSWNETVVYTQTWWAKWNWILPICRGTTRDFRRNAGISFYAWSDGDPFDKAQQRQTYLNHNRRVRQMVPKDQLLEYGAKGATWEPLCKFLDKEIPNPPYPYAASRERFHQAMTGLWKAALLTTARRLAAGSGVLLTIVFTIRYLRSK